MAAAELHLCIQVLPSTEPQTFDVLCDPATLVIAPSSAGVGWAITVADISIAPRVWYAWRLVSVSFTTMEATTHERSAI